MACRPFHPCRALQSFRYGAGTETELFGWEVTLEGLQSNLPVEARLPSTSNWGFVKSGKTPGLEIHFGRRENSTKEEQTDRTWLAACLSPQWAASQRYPSRINKNFVGLFISFIFSCTRRWLFLHSWLPCDFKGTLGIAGSSSDLRAWRHLGRQKTGCFCAVSFLKSRLFLWTSPCARKQKLQELEWTARFQNCWRAICFSSLNGKEEAWGNLVAHSTATVNSTGCTLGDGWTWWP